MRTGHERSHRGAEALPRPAPARIDPDGADWRALYAVAAAAALVSVANLWGWYLLLALDFLRLRR